MTEPDILRHAGFSPVPTEVARYTSSIKSDIPLIEPVIEINKAHIVMLAEKGVLKKIDSAQILKALDEIKPGVELDPILEDVHMNIEAHVIKKLGEKVGGKLHVAKSRNDQVATAIRMALREYLLKIAKSLIELRRVTLNKCEDYLEAVKPGYTHLQHAQPTTIAHHLLAHHDTFERDTKRLIETYKRVNLSPMGACALVTTSFNIDRKLVAELLGFEDLIENSIDAVSARDFVVEVLADLALIMTNLSVVGEELTLWSTSEFSVVKLQDEFVSTSSIMPQKRNPVVAELLRAKSAHIYGDLIATLTILKALPLSYNLDLQEITPHLWNACEVTLASIKIASDLLRGIKFDKERFLKLVSDSFSTATDLAEMLVREHDIPFRTAHRIVGKLNYEMTSKGKGIKELTPETVSYVVKESTGRTVQLEKEEILAALDPIESVKTKKGIGGPSPSEVFRMKNDKLEKIVVDEEWCKNRVLSLDKARSQLQTFAESLEGGD